MITKISLSNFVATEALELRKILLLKFLQIIVAAKVDVIDQYAESLKIDKFDLAIDWDLYWIIVPYSLQLITFLNIR